MHYKTAAGWAAVVVAALAGVADGQSSGCAPYQRYVSALKNFDLPFVSKACSSLLHYSAATQTVTQTATDTRTITVATTTNIVAAQTRTRRATQTFTTSTTQTVTLTNTITSYKYSVVTQTSTFGAGVTPRAAGQDSEKPWGAFGLPESVVSQACSCYIPKPTGAVTKTKTVTETTRQSVTATVKKTSGTLFTTQTVTTTETNLDVQGVYTYITEHPDSTLTVTVTSCSGNYPKSSFNLQVSDITATRTDSYNNLYATPAPYRGLPDLPFYALNYVPTKPQAVGGGLFNIDCLGRLHVQAPGGGKVLYAAVSTYQPGFEMVYWL
ncbi:unnamed protein product [Clonostachys chloroleuca]|uniref:Uncharacterized protein n=1 Tax=Clonostachys chloroleuca TaxID=1926264 RepID=A0AA35Q0R2_9HYPO|nr:unnamed protein product [Clonostachys chloroleuca]